MRIFDDQTYFVMRVAGARGARARNGGASVMRTCRDTLLNSAGWTSLMFAGSLLVSCPSWAQGAPVYQFDIPSESLSQALKDFSAASSRQIVFSDAIVGNRAAPAVHGSYTSDQALSLLL